MAPELAPSFTAVRMLLFVYVSSQTRHQIEVMRLRMAAGAVQQSSSHVQEFAHIFSCPAFDFLRLPLSVSRTVRKKA